MSNSERTRGLISNSRVCFFIKSVIYASLVISSPVFATEEHKVLNDTRGLLSSQIHLDRKNVKSFSSKVGVPVSGSTDQAKINSFLQSYGKDFSKTASLNNFKLLKGIETDHVGFTTAKYHQSITGIKVTGSYMNINLKGGKVRSVFSNLIDEIPSDLKLAPTLSKARAVVVAKNIFSKRIKYDVNVLQSSEPVLELFNWGVLGRTSELSETKLTWYVELTGDAVREQVWIDAHTGRLINRINNIHSAKNREVYDAQDTGFFQNTLVRSEGQEPTEDLDTNSAYDFSGEAYDYFFNEHSLDSFDGEGATIISNVHYCLFFCPEENAFWDGIQLTFGEGFATDDIVVHELTHAVIEHSADLIYQDQSGALNESYADIFGETVDLGNTSGDDAASQRWFVGEDIGAIRSMNNPGLFGDPETVSDPNFICNQPFFDNGGVHINSGVPNKAYSLMVDGGSFNGFTVNGIGLSKAGKIQYRALSTYLGPSSTFLDNYNSLILSCSDLVGTSGISANDCDQVEAALNAVEMNGQVCFTEPVEPEPPLNLVEFCPKGESQSSYFTDGFENINANTLSTTTLVSLNMWDSCEGVPNVYCNNDPQSGTYNLSGNDINQVSDSVVTLPAFEVMPDSLFSFDHKYDYERTYDGAVVEYSIDNGANWVDALELYKSGLDYTFTISLFDDNPLTGREAFSGKVAGDNEQYLRTVLDLSSLSGETIQIRFRIGTDQVIGGFDGWRIDDVSAYQCSPNDGDILDFFPAILNAVSKK